ncbi:MAG: MBL fold metallo-hydrolase [Deltaproteobacteria bacterium]|nr:MBL fold metallo-hydrolase [Deltaproteobacteria bacterium]
MAIDPKVTEHGLRVGDVEFIWARNSREFFFSNSILIHDTQTTIVDPSSNFTYLEQLASRKIVTQVLNTHYHVDHRSLNHLFRHCQFICHEKDLAAILSFDNYLKYADSERDSDYVHWLKNIFSSLEILDGYVSILLKDKELVPLKDHAVRALHIPGHTPGHLALFFEDIDLLYTSDIDLTPLGPWYANISSDIDQFLQSIHKVKMFHCRYYATSHGGRIYDREQFLEKLEKFESAFEKRDTRILESLKEKPQDLKELSQVGIVFKSSHLSDPLKACFERQMVEKHLLRFERQGKAVLENGLWHLNE